MKRLQMIFLVIAFMILWVLSVVFGSELLIKILEAPWQVGVILLLLILGALGVVLS